MDKKILEQLTKLSFPGAVLTYTSLNNPKDTSTVTDINGEIAKAIKIGKVGEIVKAIYSNTKFSGKVATDDKGIVKVLDNKGNLQNIEVQIINNSVLKLTDPVNKKTTTIEYKAPEKTSSSAVVKPLQVQLQEMLNKKKYSDKELITIMKNMLNGK